KQSIGRVQRLLPIEQEIMRIQFMEKAKEERQDQGQDPDPDQYQSEGQECDQDEGHTQPPDAEQDDWDVDLDLIDYLNLEDDNDDESVIKEPSSRRLRGLQKILRMLIESPALNGIIDAAWVARSAPAGSEYSLQERQVVANIANALRPFVPQRRADEDGEGSRSSLPHITLRAPLVVLANHVFRVAGYSKFCMAISPTISAAATYALQLNATGIYEVFCSKENDQFDVSTAVGRPISSVAQVTSSAATREAMFSAYFDMKKIHSLCRKNGMKFAQR
ncbi:hypothetical protein BGZ98_005778, partial [Dissophora globulifera]